MLILPSEEIDYAIIACVHVENTDQGRRMIENGPISTGSDAELLSRVLAEVKTKTYGESEVSLVDTQALDLSFEF